MPLLENVHKLCTFITLSANYGRPRQCKYINIARKKRKARRICTCKPEKASTTAEACACFTGMQERTTCIGSFKEWLNTHSSRRNCISNTRRHYWKVCWRMRQSCGHGNDCTAHGWLDGCVIRRATYTTIDQWKSLPSDKMDRQSMCWLDSV